MEENINILYIGTNKEVMKSLKLYPRFRVVLWENVRDQIIDPSMKIPDVIMCEQTLPETDGFRVHEHLRKLGFLNEVPFILLSQKHSAGLLTVAKKTGIDDVFIAPLPPVNDFLGRIKFLIEYRRNNHAADKDFIQAGHFRIPPSKRVFDILVAASALLLLSPVLLLVMIAIRLESKGKVYYTSTRVGRKPFTFYKFRSMRSGAEKELSSLASRKNQYVSREPTPEIDWRMPCPCEKRLGFTYCSPVLHTANYSICDTWYIEQKKRIEKSKPGFIKIPDDPRVTRIGRIIRNTSIDELPQLINVIKGDMSIVGNRPLPIYEAEKLTSDALAKRFLAPAGMTGLWQVEKRGKKGVLSEDERKMLDNNYAELFIKKKYSFFYDIKLILRTFPVLLQKESV